MNYNIKRKNILSYIGRSKIMKTKPYRNPTVLQTKSTPRMANCALQKRNKQANYSHFEYLLPTDFLPFKRLGIILVHSDGKLLDLCSPLPTK